MQQSPDVIRWLREFAEAVRAADYTRGRAMFSPEVVAFGTRTASMVDLDDLHDNQWTHIWGATRGFDFDYETCAATVSGDLAWAAAKFSSEGRRDGEWFTRHGRATYILERSGGRWLCVHSHHSLDPVRP